MLKNNGILRENVRELKIEVSGNILKVTFEINNSDLCTRLKDMDWDIQSINCYTDSGLEQKCSDSNCNKKLYFTPK